MGTELKAGMPIDGAMVRRSAASAEQRPPVVTEPGHKTDKHEALGRKAGGLLRSLIRRKL